VPVDLRWTPQAREDLVEIYTYIVFDSQPAAERIFDSIQRRSELLARHPRLGARHPEIQRSTRMFIEGVYLILYEPHPDTDEGPLDFVEIVRVVDGRRNLKSLF